MWCNTCACRHTNSTGANGPWGMTNTSFGYTGTDPIYARCPVDEVITGMAASTSLAGFNYLSVSLFT